MKRALFLNWRDVKHPKAGGAEYATLELAKGLLKKGWQVDWFASQAAGLSKRETVDGVTVIREGNALTVQGAARRYYRAKPRDYYAFVLDQSHGLPFFAPRYTRCPTMYMICEVTGEIARYMLPWPLSTIYFRLEPFIIRYYSRVPAVTISHSTAAEMKALGFRSPIAIVDCGFDVQPLAALPALSTKEPELTIIFAARLVPLKRPVEVIAMLRELVKEYPQAQLWILGSGDERYVARLKRMAEQFNLTSNVTFWGFVPLAKKHELMRRAHFVTITSVKEGWGLTVIEANALGTVAVTYNIAGVRDSNLNAKTGILSAQNTPASLARAIIRLYRDQAAYTRLRRAAWERSKQLTWSRAQDVFNTAVNSCIKNYHGQNG